MLKYLSQIDSFFGEESFFKGILHKKNKLKGNMDPNSKGTKSFHPFLFFIYDLKEKYPKQLQLYLWIQ